jgi:hypothetical protein
MRVSLNNPYQATYPGGLYFYDRHEVSVRLVPAYEQSGTNPITGVGSQGSKFSTFYSGNAG